MILYGERLLASCPTLKLEDYPLLAVCGCLFIIFAAALHIWELSPLSARRPLRSPRCRWEDNIRMNVKEIGYESVDWILMGQDRDQWWAVVNMVMNLWVP
jgi:hypothetical protein